MTLVSICRAYMDLIVEVSEEELAETSIPKGGGGFLKEDRLQYFIDKYIGRGQLLPGGHVANSAAMFAHLGGKATFIGKVSDDKPGQIFTNDFTRRGVTFKTSMENGEKGTGCCMVFITPDRERTFAFNPRIADDITEEDIEIHQRELKNAKYLFIGHTNRVEKCHEAVKLACLYAEKAKIIISLHGYLRSQTKIGKNLITADILIGNQNEYTELLHDLDQPSLQDLSCTYPKKIFACTKGTQGSTIFFKGEEISAPATLINSLIDTTGAGDAWAAGFLYGLSKNLDLHDAAILGSKAATQILTVLGGRPTLEYR